MANGLGNQLISPEAQGQAHDEAVRQARRRAAAGIAMILTVLVVSFVLTGTPWYLIGLIPVFAVVLPRLIRELHRPTRFIEPSPSELARRVIEVGASPTGRSTKIWAERRLRIREDLDVLHEASKGPLVRLRLRIPPERLGYSCASAWLFAGLVAAFVFREPLSILLALGGALPIAVLGYFAGSQERSRLRAIEILVEELRGLGPGE